MSNGMQLASKVEESPENTPVHFNLPLCCTLLWWTSFALNLGPWSRRGPAGSLNTSLPYHRQMHYINKAQTLKMSCISCPCYSSWKARFVQQSDPVVLWSVNEAQAKQAKRNELETAFMGQRYHWKSAQELQKQAVSTPCWKDWWARGAI